MTLAFILVSCISVGLIGFLMHRTDTMNAAAETAEYVAISIATSIDGNRMKACIESGEVDDYWNEVKIGFDKARNSMDISYLYMIDAEYSDVARYIMEGYSPESPFPESLFGEADALDYFSEEIFETIRDGQPRASSVYTSEGYGKLVSGFAPIMDDDNNVIAAVGVDMNIDRVFEASNTFGVRSIFIILAYSCIFGALSYYYLKRRVGNPINALTEASRQIATGDMEVKLDIHSNDEIGELANSFREMIESTNEEVDILSRLSEGDLSVNVTPRSENDTMGIAIKKTVNSLNIMFNEIMESASQVSSASTQIADGAQSLAQGATEQAATMSIIAASVEHIADQTETNTEMANQAAKLATGIQSDAQQSAAQMQDMVNAVNDINEASQAIARVINMIEDIAFQTNILALNAAVEAARAGQHGKGFAVVAEEVRNLAAKSAESAKETASLIDNSVSKAELGVQIANSASESLSRIIESIEESGRIVSSISEASEVQNADIRDVNTNIEQIQEVVQENSATAEESAASSEQLSSQANMLVSLVKQFKLKE